MPFLAQFEKSTDETPNGATAVDFSYVWTRANKFDSFDTRVSETIELFLLPKILAGQGFFGFFHF